MALDPRTQLALTMVTGLMSQQEPGNRKRPSMAKESSRLSQKRERRSMEALTQALLDPCTTVQEAVLDSLLQRSMIDSSSSSEKDWASY